MGELRTKLKEMLKEASGPAHALQLVGKKLVMKKTYPNDRQPEDVTLPAEEYLKKKKKKS